MARRSRRSSRPGSPEPASDKSPEQPIRPWLPGWLKIGILLLFFAASAYGFLEVHSSTDTYIGLAAGRQIMTSDEFPTADTFSYTFGGKTWFNQNWLTHVYLWLLHDYFGPDFVIYGTWALCLGLFSFVVFAARLRCGAWMPAVLAGSMVAIASRDWLSARPATMQFFLMALCWLALQGLLSQRGRVRWWPIVVLALAFLVWPHAHGSFVFGYGLVAMFLGFGVVARVVGQRAAFTPAQFWSIVGVVVVTAILGFVLSPYGIENYTHPFKVAKSDVFRQVGEWQPPYVASRAFPPVKRFWIALSVTGAFLGLAVALKLADRTPATDRRQTRRESSPPPWIHMVLLDVAAVTVGLSMAMWARRFAPILYILATPVFVSWIMSLGRTLSPRVRAWSRDVAIAAAYPLLIATIFVTAKNVQKETIEPFPDDRPYNLLDRITRTDQVAYYAMEFLRRNELTPRIMTEWTQAGLIMFYVPGATVYIDGRSQQVYNERHYVSYTALVSHGGQAEWKVSELERTDTEAVLLRRTRSVAHLANAVHRDRDWVRVFHSEAATLFARRDSDFYREVIRREREGNLWWPESPFTLAARGRLRMRMQPPDYSAAAEMLRTALDQKPLLAIESLDAYVLAMTQLERTSEASAYLRELDDRAAAGDVSERYRDAVRKTIAHWQRRIEHPSGGRNRSP